ncbi:hypothetical protein MB46_13005 [Arthrobacter alpinus]|uniref:hypothetical protein n=1 Tax=Arthrobacter alpinus TaxID=656366 RepID=UPI0005C9B2F2|nr:hypothetical protein [Arthrobacter alpinus]ALV46266.1 hypothetical protein MB46_13005 [Arthrobacter alpinus]
MSPPSHLFASALNATPRGRAAALMLATGAVVLVFAVMALVNPTLGGQPRGLAAGIGALVFAAVLLLLWMRTRTLPAVQPPGESTEPSLVKKKAAILATIAVVLWLMAGLFWYFATLGVNLRYGMDPVVLAVPLTIYPLLILGARKLANTARPKVEGR